MTASAFDDHTPARRPRRTPVGQARFPPSGGHGLDVATTGELQAALDESPIYLVGGLLFLSGLVVGLLLLGIALARSGLAPAWMGVALAIGGFTHPFMPNHITAGFGLIVAAVGFAGGSVALLRMADDDFDLPPLPAPAGGASS